MARIVQPTFEAIEEAAEILRGGGLVAFPTETVYGLGANALDADAVARIFAAKGRPSTNPIIVHVGSIDEARQLADISTTAEHLADDYWPGPLTLVVPRKDVIPDIVTAGGPTVGIRVPRHPVALVLLEMCGFPLAAPSANRSEQVSPTLAQHVADSLGDEIDMILDGGPCEVGIESTVLDATVEPPRILRPGTISDKDGYRWDRKTSGEAAVGEPSRSPGNHVRHYAPRAPLWLVDDLEDFWHIAASGGKNIPLMGHVPPPKGRLRKRWLNQLPNDPQKYAAQLYATLVRLDWCALLYNAPYILCQAPPTDPEWESISDRLTRAAVR